MAVLGALAASPLGANGRGLPRAAMLDAAPHAMRGRTDAWARAEFRVSIRLEERPGQHGSLASEATWSSEDC